MRPQHLIACAALLTLTSAAHAQDGAPPPAKAPTSKTVTAGKVELPLSGLLVDLPARGKGHSYALTSSWSIDQGFDARDVIDEKVDGKLVAGTWVLVGYFTAGDCKAVVANTTLESAWDDKWSAHSVDFTVRGGVFDFGTDSLGKAPTVALCAERPKLAPGTRKALLLYHYFLDLPVGTGQAEIMKALGNRSTVDRVIKSWRTDTVASGRPLESAAVRVRGDAKPAERLALKHAGLELSAPADGTYWVARAGDADDGVDWLDRMIPALPELNVEVFASVLDCAATIESVTTERMKAAPPHRNVPTGWIPGPVLNVDGDPEYLVCAPAGTGSFVVGVFQEKAYKKELGDLAPVRALLDSLLAARK